MIIPRNKKTIPINTPRWVILFGILFTCFIHAHAQYKLYAFIDPDCPICQYYIPVLHNIALSNKTNNISFCYVIPAKFISGNVRNQYKNSVNKIICHKNEHIIIDKENKLVNQMGAKITPEVFLWGPQNELIYSGAVDDKYVGVGIYRQMVTSHYLMNAIYSILNNEMPIIRNTIPVGCIIEK